MLHTIINFLVNNWILLTGGVFLGLCTGMLTGLFGAGGGFIITPALNVFFGLPYNLAVGTSACQVFAASGLSIYHHLDRKFYGVRIALLAGIGVPLGSFIGVRSVNNFKDMGDINLYGKILPAQDFYFTCFFIVLLTLIAAWLFFDNLYLRRGKTDDDHKGYLAWIKIPPMVKFRTILSGPFSAPVLVLLGFGMGFLGGLLGIGGGVIMLPILFYLVGQETKYAAQTSTMLIFLSAMFSTFFHARHSNIDYSMVLFLISGALVGTKLGVVIQKSITGKSLRKYFAYIILAAIVMVVYKMHLIISVALPVNAGT